MEELLREAQDYICKSVEEMDGKGKFKEDAYLREKGGGGRTRVMSGGNVWDKAGIGLAVVHGNIPSENLEKKAGVGDRSKFNSIDRTQGFKPGEKIPFVAVGLSSVMHPENPHCPTMHFNYRYFETASGLWWFGGGQDITPAYLDEDDMKHFHGTLKKACDKHDKDFFPYFKSWADDYYRIPHRNETRGLGGIFYDDLNDRPAEEILALQKELVMSVPDAYLPIIKKHKNDEFDQKQKDWQLMRRGRYVEFNLVYDRGTIFGLKTGLGRTESILMTLPLHARWEYDHQILDGSPEHEIMDAFRFARDWV